MGKKTIVLMAIFLGGCATMKEYRDTPVRVEQLEKQIDSMQSNYAKLNARIDELHVSNQIVEGKIEENRYENSGLKERLDAIENNLGQRIFMLEQKTFPSKKEITSPSDAEDKKTTQGGSDSNIQQFNSTNLSPRELYQTAYDDYVKRNYDLALAGFQRYIKQYPAGELSGGAQYWIGECYYSKKDFVNAISEFDKVIKLYATNNKVAAAKLKKAYSLIQISDKPKALSILDEIIKQYPLSTEAKLAKDKKTELASEQ